MTINESLIAFLKERLLEDFTAATSRRPDDIAAASAHHHPRGPLRWIGDAYRRIDEHRMLTEKLARGDWSTEAAAVIRGQRDYVVRRLQDAADEYADHPEYDPAWRPR